MNETTQQMLLGSSFSSSPDGLQMPSLYPGVHFPGVSRLLCVSFSSHKCRSSGFALYLGNKHIQLGNTVVCKAKCVQGMSSQAGSLVWFFLENVDAVKGLL